MQKYEKRYMKNREESNFPIIVSFNAIYQPLKLWGGGDYAPPPCLGFLPFTQNI